MSDNADRLARAKQLEAEGKADEAVRAYLAAGSLNDAVRVLVGADRYEQAGKLVMAALKVKAEDVGNLPPGKKRFVKSAALYFAKAGMENEAVELLTNLGDHAAAERVIGRSRQSLIDMKRISSKPPNSARPRSSAPPASAPAPRVAVPPPRRPTPQPAPRVVEERGPVSRSSAARKAAVRLERDGALDMALSAYVKQHQFADAARVCVKLGELPKAARYYEQSGRLLEAAECLFEAGEIGAGLETLVHIPRDHVRYRQACIRAIGVAKELGTLDFNFDRFVSRFVRAGVENEHELEAFYDLGRLYEAHDFESNANEAFEHVQSYSPGYRDVEERLNAQEEDARQSDMVFEKIVRQDQAFRSRRSRMPKARTSRAPELEDLPDLPDLEELDAIQRASGRPGSSMAPERSSSPDNLRSLPTEPPNRASKQRTGELDIADDIYDIPANTTVSDRYRIEGLLGEGGMAAVYRAVDLELEVPIALKIFAVSRRDETLLARFRRELMLARELAHENIVRVYDIGVHAGRRFITMELLSGTDLRDKLDEPISIAAAKNYLIQACRGLGHAHDKGVVHRDVKPENFFVTDDDVVKVMDFGIAKKQEQKDKNSRHLTGEGYTAGTPAYMAPEQITDFGGVSHSCDIYSLGIIAFELIGGALPFEHEESMPLLMMHLNDEPPHLGMLRDDIPAALDDLVMAMLEKDPKDRPQSCAAIVEVLESITV